jgi:phage/plasmid-like protein (TIGR03299 family)
MGAVPEVMVSGRGIMPWHGIGNVKPGLFDAVTAFNEGGLNFPVELVPAGAFVNGVWVPSGSKAVVRTDNNKVLGEGLTEQYKILQNQTLVNVLERLTGPTGGARFDTAGTLEGGKRVWAMCLLDEDVPLVIAGQEIQRYFVIVNAHDGMRSLKTFVTPVRPVCQNTLNAGLKSAKAVYSSKHVGTRMDEDVLVQAIAGEFSEHVRLYYTEFEKFCNSLLNVKISKNEVQDFVTKELMPERRNLSTKGTTILEKAREQVLSCIFEKPDLQDVQGTAFALYNGVVDYNDNVRRINEKGLSDTPTAEEREAAMRDFRERKWKRSFEENDMKDLTLAFIQDRQKILA